MVGVCTSHWEGHSICQGTALIVGERFESLPYTALLLNLCLNSRSCHEKPLVTFGVDPLTLLQPPYAL